ncbi:MAG: hypothetical protein ABIH23_03775 [bacterium]
MGDQISHAFRFMTDWLPVYKTQGGKPGSFGFKFMNPEQVNTDVLLYILSGIALLVFTIVYGSYRYNRWRRFKEFEDEMKSLDLNPEQEGTLGDMVRRYQVGEPVQILYSPKLFDDMATAEMKRILGSQGSAEAKEKFINAIYNIRTKTYHPDWIGELAPREASSSADSSSGS